LADVSAAGAEEMPAEDIQLMAQVQAGRIILLWDPPNSAPSDGVKVQRALSPDFTQGTIDQYTKWLPGTGYSQVVLFPSAASEKTYYYRVSSIRTGEYAHCLAVSNPVMVEGQKKEGEEQVSPGRKTALATDMGPQALDTMP
jgi:hypothetical protein